MSNPLSRDIPKTFGALLLGGLFGSFLSGATTVQTIVYLKLYPEDHPFTKGLVTVIWALDVTHTALTWIGLWTYFISDFGDADKINTIPLAISVRQHSIVVECNDEISWVVDHHIYRDPYPSRSLLLCATHLSS